MSLNIPFGNIRHHSFGQVSQVGEVSDAKTPALVRWMQEQ